MTKQQLLETYRELVKLIEREVDSDEIRSILLENDSTLRVEHGRGYNCESDYLYININTLFMTDEELAIYREEEARKEKERIIKQSEMIKQREKEYILRKYKELYGN